MHTEFIESIKLIPSGENAKLIIRHSIRESLKESDSPDEVPLTYEGKINAVNFGKNMQYIPIGEVYSSNVRRCIQTIRCIIEGMSDTIEYPISLVDMRNFYSPNIQQSYRTFRSEKNGKNVVVKLINGITLPGFYSIRDIALNQLNFIFGTGGQLSHWDIYCTHDFQIICLISALFKNINNIDEVNSYWPNMLESIVLWGNIDNFYCVWRGNICHIINQNF